MVVVAPVEGVVVVLATGKAVVPAMVLVGAVVVETLVSVSQRVAAEIHQIVCFVVERVVDWLPDLLDSLLPEPHFRWS